MCLGNVDHGEDCNETDGEAAVHGVFSRSLYCRYVLPELYKIFHVRDALVRATLLRHFHRYADMFDATTLTQVVIPEVSFIPLSLLTVVILMSFDQKRRKNECTHIQGKF